jgi:hypothetical protein
MKIIKKETRPNMMSKITSSIKAINSMTTISRSTAVVKPTSIKATIVGITRTINTKQKSRNVTLYDSDDESDDYESSRGKEEETDEDLDEETKTLTFKGTRSPYYTRSIRNPEKNRFTRK